MQLFILFTFIIGVCYAAPSELLDGNNDKLSPVGEASSFNSEVQPVEPELPKHGCNIFDPILVKNCTDEADTYLDDSRRTCCQQITMNNCKIRLLRQVCSAEEYVKKVNSLESISQIVWTDSPDCPKNYDKSSYCDVSIGESLAGLPPSWVFTGVLVFLVVIFLLAIIFGIKYC